MDMFYIYVSPTGYSLDNEFQKKYLTAHQCSLPADSETVH